VATHQQFRRRRVPFLAALLAMGATIAVVVGLTAGTAGAAITIGSVTCDLPQYNPTHFALQVGQTVTCTISDPSLVVNGPVNVNIQSSSFGNETVIGTGDTSTHLITFTYTGAEVGCSTTSITYDKTADGGNSGVTQTKAGFAIVDGSGVVIPCANTGNPNISTDASDTGTGVAGDTLQDTAHLSNGTTVPPIGGTITFTVYAGTDTTCSTPLNGTGEVVPVDSGNGDYSTTTGFVAPTAGTYQWVASYSGDGNNTPVSSSCNDPREATVVTQAAPNVATEIHLSPETTPHPTPVTGPVALGTTVHDSATATAPSSLLPTPTGKVTFSFYSGTCADAKNGTLIGTPDDVTLAGGVADPSADQGPLHAGSYFFLAHYTPDAASAGIYTGGDATCEPLTVNQGTSTTATEIHLANETVVSSPFIIASGSTVHDKATVTGTPAAFTPTGDVTFTFFTGGDCTTGTAHDAGTVTLDVNGVAHPSNSAGPLAAGSYAFQASYPGNGDYTKSTSACEPLIVLGTQNGLTLGFYSNQNGQTALTGSSRGTTLLASVSSCVFGPLKNGATTNSVLVNGSGVYQTVAFFSTYANVKSYLLNANATNMAYMLSAQLLTTEFNICLGKVVAAKSIYVPAVTLPGTSTHLSATLQNALATNNGANPWAQVSGVSPDPGGVAKIQTILDAAIAQLKVNPNTTAAGPNRTYQEALKDLLDGINNNETIFLP